MKNITKKITKGIILPAFIASSLIYNGFSQNKEAKNVQPLTKIEESQRKIDLSKYNSNELEEIYEEKLKKDKEFLENPEAKKFDLEKYTKEKKKKKNIFENFLSNLKFEYELNCGYKEKLQDFNYEKEKIFFQNIPKTDITISNNNFNLTNTEISQVNNIFDNLMSRKINSYQDFCSEGKKLNENQKIIFLSSTSSMLDSFTYSLENLGKKAKSQNIFFSTLQNSLINNKYIPLGQCTHIATHIEKLGEEIGAKIDTVGSTGHAYNIMSTEKGFIIINYSNILRIKNHNLEDLLRAYQKEAGKTAFVHEFYDKEELQHRIITENGKNFLEAVNYDFSRKSSEKNLIVGLNNSKKSKEQKKSLLDYTTSPNLDIGCKINISNYLKKGELNIEGLFINGGTVKGNSPMKKIDFYQVGLNKALCFNDTFTISANVNYIGGNLLEESRIYSEKISKIYGGMCDIMFSFNQKEGLNLNLETMGILINKDSKRKMEDCQNNTLKRNYQNLFRDMRARTGMSYNFLNKHFEIKPFFIISSEIFFSKLNGDDKSFLIDEYGGGFYSKKKCNDFSLNVKPYFFKKTNENEFGCECGVDYSINNKNFGIKLGVSHSESTYLFNPNKTIIEAGLLAKIGGLEAEINYKNEETSDFKKESKNNQSTYGLSLNYKF